MIIDIAAEGGFGGIAAARLRKTIDVDDQPEQMRQDLCHAFGPDELARLARTPCGDCADRLTYRITVTEDRQTRSFTLREQQIPPDMLDLIDQM
ncbi:protealysin inhibitor emfourin [uncultured Paracoccus sp.]|uniref:protealysin inhibitor emfourin n=1 Tax=uncultured Paracoccus sp. TaxID=189685 RepID=UPI0025CE1C4E|nr:protealysin inhibitor emfourin [uncultured Paracoccus sp.]